MPLPAPSNPFGQQDFCHRERMGCDGFDIDPHRGDPGKVRVLGGYRIGVGIFLLAQVVLNEPLDGGGPVAFADHLKRAHGFLAYHCMHVDAAPVGEFRASIF
jgi:hypothetical protein